MSDAPDAAWLTIVGLGEDGPSGLSLASREALAQAELVAGAVRHLALLPDIACETMEWPVPFDQGIAQLLQHRGRRVVMLASGDPFWFGAGSVVAKHLTPGEWVAYPAPSTFSLAASRLGWALDETACLGLHAASFSRLRPHLAPGQRLLVLVRNGKAVAELADYLSGCGFGTSKLHVLEALGGPRERICETRAEAPAWEDIAHPVAVGIECAGEGAVLSRVSGISNALFDHDGQISKQPVRALTLSALAPRPGETLWDIGAGSGSVGIEWLLSHSTTQAIAFESDPVRAARATANAEALGVDRLNVILGSAPQILEGHRAPDAVFIGGGLSQSLLEILWSRLTIGTRLVANAVTLESEALLSQWHALKGGNLLRIELSEAAPLGARRGWRAHYPIVQWSVVL